MNSLEYLSIISQQISLTWYFKRIIGEHGTEKKEKKRGSGYLNEILLKWCKTSITFTKLKFWAQTFSFGSVIDRDHWLQRSVKYNLKMYIHAPAHLLQFFFRCDTIDKLKMKCPSLEQEIREPSKFKDFYQFTFNYAKNPGQKGLGRSQSKVLDNGRIVGKNWGKYSVLLHIIICCRYFL